MYYNTKCSNKHNEQLIRMTKCAYEKSCRFFREELDHTFHYLVAPVNV